jgi:diaminohydroxyphosphoribosylaminopyrimidine deaminase / 5-amino-6-(5-phosphoribosylamino)uracil reductase
LEILDDEVTGSNSESSPADKYLGQVISPALAMRLAIREGHRGAGFVSPNPLVGCTIVDRDHRLLAVGFHRKVGTDHAEIDALKKLSSREQLKGAHMYVTLEPCAHQGRTPSCARTVAPLKPASVTYAVADPNPIAENGAGILRAAGVTATKLLDREDISFEDRRDLTEAAEDLAEIFLHGLQSSEPFVAVKVATTLDGKMALANGESKWITGEKAREHVQLVRARYDGVLIGRNTFTFDNPSLNVRHERYPEHRNSAIIFDPHGKTLTKLKGSNLLKARPAEKIFVVIKKGNGTKNPAGVQLIEVSAEEDGSLSIEEALPALRTLGLASIMIEGGASTFGAFFNARKVRRLHAYLAPSLLGGQHGISWSAGFGGSTMKEKIRLERSRRKIIGSDLYWTARVR